MTFEVNADAIRGYAAELQFSYSEVESAMNYVHVYGDFSFHEAGIIGALAGQHADFMRQLDELHRRLLIILWRSPEALREIAATYDGTDVSASGRIDATYPASPRPVPRRD